MLGGLLQTTLHVLYPPQCLTCDAAVEADYGLCGRCWRDASFVAGAICDTCGTPLLGEADDTPLQCDDCLKIARPWSRGRAALVYRGTGKKLVLALKHGDRHDIVRPAAQWMARIAAPLMKPDTVFVPVPSHLLRLAKRRYNQSALLAKALGQELNTEWAPEALIRAKRTPSLDGQSRDARFETLSNAIRPHPRFGSLLAGRPVVIVDDVMTSGATLAATTEAAFSAGAKEVCAVVLARVAKDA